MKTVLTIFLLITINISFSQIEKLKGNWVSDINEFISIKDTLKSENWITNSHLRNENFYLSLKNDIISFQSRYYFSDNMEKMYTNRYDLKILKLNDSILIIKPSSKNSISFFGKDKPLKFIR
ncbi:hypothetical protein [Flavobacterium gilvum]|uniref:Uncharacterized protein n=1 Tax=Flavobacterium gilvum TaxID=1492737 RepID=A0AAC9I895_9FLAO|nr:hypothetical protein [Flavobacterium gilvum]AOW09872.1 hypothetical protein EM308_10335 [Flavobacterium gilvum]KFC58585.1 hypothetical protein FEM08_26360 [Flavobacterium gilvum]